MLEVMFYEVFKEEEEALKRFLPPGLKAGFTPATIQESADSALPAPLISIRTQSVIPDDWVGQFSGVLTRSTGFDHLKVYQKRNKIDFPCGYLPSYCSRSVAEQALLMILALLRHFKSQLRQFTGFNRDGLTGVECLHRQLLVVGVGCIGIEVAQLGLKMGMDVRGVDLDPRVSSLEYVSLEEGLAWAEIVVCALPLTDKTQGLLGYEALKTLKPGAFLVNVSRGEITPLEALEKLLREGVLGGIALDVFGDEDIVAGELRSGRPGLEAGGKWLALSQQDNVLLTPHNAFNTREALERKARESAEAVTQFLDKGTFPDAPSF